MTMLRQFWLTLMRYCARQASYDWATDDTIDRDQAFEQIRQRLVADPTVHNFRLTWFDTGEREWPAPPEKRGADPITLRDFYPSPSVKAGLDKVRVRDAELLRRLAR